MVTFPSDLKEIRKYDALIWKDDLSIGVRVHVLAVNLEDARQKLEFEYGKGTVFNLHCEEDANKPR